jgi:cation diffusion facilitator family transporter
VQDGSRKAIVAALLANFGITIAKLVGWLVTGAASMLAEAVHSFADTGNQALLLWGTAAAKRPATEDHPFGFARERYFWSFVVALVIFSLGSLFAIYEGVDKLRHPHALESPMWAVGILAVAIVLESFSFRTAIIEGIHAKGELGWWEFIRKTKTPELPVVLLEDLGALLGLVLALGGVGLAMLTGDARFDAMGSISIGVLLGVIAIVLAIEMRSLLLGEGATKQDRAAIREEILSAPHVKRLIHLRTQHFSPDELLIALKVEFDGSLTFEQLTSEIDSAEDRIRARIPTAKLIYIEPDVFRAAPAVDPDEGKEPTAAP